MRDHNETLNYVEMDHTDLAIALYKKGEQPPITPTFAMIVDNLTGQVVRRWLEWPEHLPVGSTSFGGLLRAAREALYLPLEEVARQIVKTDQQAVSVGYLRAIELGKRFPSSELIPQFARVFQLPEDVLYYSLGRLPADLCAVPATSSQIQEAFQAMRTSLRSD